MDRQGLLTWKDWVQNAALRVCLGAFQTTSVSNRHVEANEPPLRLRSQKLALQYIVKLKLIPGNLADSSVFQPNYMALFDAKQNIVPTLGLRLHPARSESGVNLNCMAERLIPSHLGFFVLQVLTIPITMWVQNPTHLLIYIFLFT
jgi:hypothetical protein